MMPSLTPQMIISEEEVNSRKLRHRCVRCSGGFLTETSLKTHSNHPTLCTNNRLIQRLRDATKVVQQAAKLKENELMMQGEPNIQINETTIGAAASFKYLGYLLTADNNMFAPIQDR